MIDGHCHLDKAIGSCVGALKALRYSAEVSQVKQIILLNVAERDYDNESVIDKAKKYNGFFKVFPSVNPHTKSAIKELQQLKSLGAVGLKLHPRLQKYRLDSKETVRLVREAGDLNMPVVIDCFPDGINLMLGNTPEKFLVLAKSAPKARIAIGHSGGHRLLDALMVAKTFTNIYLDLSFMLLYYRNSSVIRDIPFIISSIRAERIFWGSDYPDRAYGETVKLSLQELIGMKLSKEVMRKVLELNVKQFLGESL